MGTLDLKKFLLGSSLMLGVAAFGVTPAAIAQDDGVAVIEDDSDEASNDDDEDTVIVTGSRVKRNTFNSIAPLQVISGEISRDVGLVDPTTILQESSAASGQQIDTTFSGFVLDNGPGSTTIDLRGLGANRTLVLINGRRVSPAGVEGAPIVPDLSLLPSTLIERFEVLLDGASSVYGSDAIAGVTNAVLRKDFDGLELEFFGNENIHQSGFGDDFTISGRWGRNTDRGFIGVGFEYDDSPHVTLADRPFTDGCDQHVEITTDGQIRNLGLGDQFNNGQITSTCKRSGLVGRTFIPFFPNGFGFGSVYATGDNSYLPGFSESGLFGIPVDANGDGATEVNFIDFSLNGRQNEATLFADNERVSIMGYGEYTFEGEMNLTPYFEALYSKRETFQDSGAFQLFPYVPANNPFNLCNPAAAGGVDCGLAFEALLNDPDFAADFQAGFGVPPTAFGFIFPGAVGAIPTEPIVSVDGDRTNTFTEVEQTRLVGGLKGDLPGLNFGQLSNWSFDVSAQYSKSEGESSRPGIRDDRLAFALGFDPTIDNDGDGLLDFNTSNLATLVELPGGACDATGSQNPVPTDVSAGCVPVNLYAPSLFNPLVGDFATQAERDYLFDSRDFDTTFEQTIFSAYVTGNAFELPAGSVGAVLGYDYRKDEIDSQPDDIAADGLFFGFFADGGAEAEQELNEFYGELVIPLLANKPYAKVLDLELSGRYTDVETTNLFTGGKQSDDGTTYSAKIGWRPIDPLLIRATQGTSFRAPNLREVGLRAQSGFQTLFDPCIVPQAAFDPLNGGYIPGNDTRDQQTLDNCVAAGIDPTTFGGGNSTGFFSVEVPRGGATDLKSETSESFSAGFVFEQPFFESFDLTFGATYYDIEIDDTIIEPGAQFIINDCFILNANLASTFCPRITRDPTTQFITDIDLGFINRDRETAAGIDYNLLFEKELTLFDRPVDLAIDVNANQLKERTTLFVDDSGNADFDEFVGEFGFGEWRGRADFRVDVDDYRFTWSTRYVDSVEQDADFIDDFGNVTGTPATSDTCLGTALGDVDCRDVGFADEYYVHAASVYYRGDTWVIGGGVRNIFDEEPPQVDGSEVLSVNNSPIGVGYDLNGRTFFFNVQKSFN